MISHTEFARLRLADFVGEVSLLDCWQFMGREWVGEAVGFSEWLRPVDDPEHLGSLALDFSALPGDVAARILRRLRLDLSPGMTFEEIRNCMGEPIEEQVFASDRRSYDFKIDDADGYYVSCTVHQDDGLIYIVVMTSHG